jgi:hypothetical protein
MAPRGLRRDRHNSSVMDISTAYLLKTGNNPVLSPGAFIGMPIALRSLKNGGRPHRSLLGETGRRRARQMESQMNGCKRDHPASILRHSPGRFQSFPSSNVRSAHTEDTVYIHICPVPKQGKLRVRIDPANKTQKRIFV